MNSLVLFHPQMVPRLGTLPFVYYEPDYTQEKELYRVNDEPINIINNSENVPFLQNVAQQQLVESPSVGLDTSGLTDQQLAASAIPRYVEINEIADASRNSFNDVINELSNVKPNE